MIKESQFMKAELRRLKKSLSEKTALETEFEDYQENILRLKQLRKQLSDALQQWLFSQFRMLNQEGESKDLLEAMKDALGDKVTDVKLTQRLKSHPVCLTSKGGLSIEMEKVLNSMPTDQKVQAERVLEINAQHPILKTLQEKYAADKDSIAEYAKLLYDQALLIEGLPIDDPVAFSNAVCKLMTK